MARTKKQTDSGRRVRDTGTGRTGRTRSGGIGIGTEHGPCDSQGRSTGTGFTRVTWDDGTKDSVPTDSLDTDG